MTRATRTRRSHPLVISNLFRRKRERRRNNRTCHYLFSLSLSVPSIVCTPSCLEVLRRGYVDTCASVFPEEEKEDAGIKSGTSSVGDAPKRNSGEKLNAARVLSCRFNE